MAKTDERSRTIQLSLTLHWVAVGLLFLAGMLLSRHGGHPVTGSLLVLGMAAAPCAWISALLAIVKDRGRIRIGAVILAAYPVIDALLWALALRSTQALRYDPTSTLLWLVTGLGLGLGTLLIVLPLELGTE